MILKHKDPIEPTIEILETLLEQDNLPLGTASKIKKEISNVRKGAQGELECAHFLDRTFKDSKNCILIHDLRIELDGDVAQIDHLMVNRFLECWILESKNFSTGIRINEHGEFEYWTGKTYIGIASPIEQGKRQAIILKKALQTQEVFLQRFGLKLKPKLKTAVLISPKGRIMRPKKMAFDSTQVMKADSFVTFYHKQLDEASTGEALIGMTRLIGRKTLLDFGDTITALHTPSQPNYESKFGLAPANQYAPTINAPPLKVLEATEEYTAKPNSAQAITPSCPTCQGHMVQRLGKKGANAGKHFWGCKSYPSCRGIVMIPNETEPNIEIETPKIHDPKDFQTCPKCGSHMILRTTKKGPNAGNQFWGCSTFPKCRKTEPIA